MLNDNEIELHRARLEALGDLRGTSSLLHEAGRGEGLAVETRMMALATFLAGRWAAKEATIKAHTSRRLTMHDITIQPGKVVDGLQQSPIALVSAGGGTRENDNMVKISISHDGDYATAVCLAADEEAYRSAQGKKR
ncbi:MAG: hypothetical protein M1818_004270 [Claussenomyces sp. TS43310]|nr:MAG: hypothetical protein M1818_004270 [Claussenomyces sp. TS43310]